jgi:hypothetical protein
VLRKDDGPVEGTLCVEVAAIVADEEHGLSASRSPPTRPAAVAYKGIHAWQFRGGKCSGFESFWAARFA